MGSKGFSITDFTRKFFTRKNKYFNYILTAFELSLETLLLLMVTVGFSAMLLFLVNACWFTYKDTHVGFVFVEQMGNNYQFFKDILNQDILKLSYYLTLSTFIFCLTIGSACQFAYLGRYFQGTSGWLQKFMYWGIPLTFVVSAYFYRWPIYAVDHWGAAYILYFVPTLCVYALCFKIANKLLPEIGSIIRAFMNATCFIIDRVQPDDERIPLPVAEPDCPDPTLAAEAVNTTKVNTTNCDSAV